MALNSFPPSKSRVVALRRGRHVVQLRKDLGVRAVLPILEGDEVRVVVNQGSQSLHLHRLRQGQLQGHAEGDNHDHEYSVSVLSLSPSLRFFFAEFK